MTADELLVERLRDYYDQTAPQEAPPEVEAQPADTADTAAPRRRSSK